MPELPRPNSDALLKTIQKKESSPRGRLKIFFGYAAGVGKTYAMLEAAHRAKEAGLDVVAGYIEPHTRPETMALLDGLEQLPTKGVPYKGIELHEFDLDGALARKPQLILVDELPTPMRLAAAMPSGIRTCRSCCVQGSAFIRPLTSSISKA